MGDTHRFSAAVWVVAAAAETEPSLTDPTSLCDSSTEDRLLTCGGSRKNKLVGMIRRLLLLNRWWMLNLYRQQCVNIQEMWGRCVAG